MYDRIAVMEVDLDKQKSFGFATHFASRDLSFSDPCERLLIV